MKVSLVSADRWPGWPAWSVAVVLGWAVLAGGVGALAPARGKGVVACPLKWLTGVPCPTCGATRCVLSALRGDLAAAVACNPLVFVAGALAAGWMFLRLGMGRTVEIQLGRVGRFAAGALLAATVPANWLYVIRYVG